MMTRRELLQSALALGIAPMAGSLQAAEPRAAFKSSFSNLRETLGPTTVTFSGQLPKGLQGTLYRNGPARLQRGTTQYHHWFDGDGMIQSFNLNANQMTHRGAMVRTSRYVAEEEAGRFLWPGFGTSFPDAKSVTKPDHMNVANTSVLPLKDEVWALWEGGSPWALDANSLETIGRKVLSPETDGLSFSAHPKVEPDGRIWNFGYMAGQNKLVIYDMSANGSLERVKVIEANKTNMVHDFAMTDQYLVFLLMPFKFEMSDNLGQSAFADQLIWEEDESVDVLVIDKNTLEVAHRFELPALFGFHFGNAWQEGQNIHLETAVSDPWSETHELFKRATMGAALNWKTTEPAAAEIILDLAQGTARTEQLPIINADFPGFDPRFAGRRTQYLTMMNRSKELPENVFGSNQVVQYDRSSQKMQHWSYGHDRIAEEHVFVPHAGKSEGVGWLLGTTYNWVTEKTSLSVLNAQAIADGPICEAQLPYRLPLGFHGKFVSA